MIRFLQYIWFGVIVLLAFLMLKGSVSALMAFLAFLGAIAIHYFTNKGDPFIVNLAPGGAGFRMFVAEFVMILALLTGNVLLFLLSAAYIPFEYFVGD
ncbi:hypothetical protein [Pyrococcus kukulkanii]|uniref:hypothetical protein n=1 Tax=Pyrococcus kukulkanii TaxID=1609559 RepID=UPI0035613AF9